MRWRPGAACVRPTAAWLGFRGWWQPEMLAPGSSSPGPPDQPGVGALDVPREVLLVEADVEAVVEALEEENVQSGVEGREIEATGDSYLVYRLDDQRWSVVCGLCVDPERKPTLTHSCFACSASELLETRAMVLTCGPEAGAFYYAFYDNGGHPKETLWYGGSGGAVFQSTRPGRSDLRVDRPGSVLEALLEEMEVFLPTWVPSAQPGAPFRAVLNDGETPARADLVTRARLKSRASKADRMLRELMR